MTAETVYKTIIQAAIISLSSLLLTFGKINIIVVDIFDKMLFK